MKKNKIIFCTDGVFPIQVGGMQRHSRMLIEHLAKMHEIELIVIHPHSQKIFPEYDNIVEEQVLEIDKNKNYLLECYRYSKRVFEVIMAHPDSIVYAQGLTVWYGISEISKRLIINPHGLEPYQCISLKDKIIAIPFKFIFNYLFRNADKVVSLGGKLTDILDHHIRNQKKVIELPNAVVLPSLNPKNQEYNGKTDILFVARFAHNKGIHILIQAIQELNKEGYSDKLNFNLGGKGPLFENYSKNFIHPNLNYLGFVSDEQLFELYQSNDLFVLPTLFEGMPTVVLEAMSYGMPIIVSDVGATSLLVDSTNGYLIEKDNVIALKKAIVSFYNLSNAQKKKLSVNSYERVKNNFTWDKVAEKHANLFKEMNKQL